MAQVRYRYPVTYAGVVLDVVSFSGDKGRAVVEHRPTRGRGAQLSDRGRNPRRDSLQIQMTGGAQEAVRKRDLLQALVESGESRTFSHPLDGEWRAKISEYSESIGPDGVMISMTLIEDTAFPSRLEEARRASVGSLQAVSSAAVGADAAFAAISAIDPTFTAPDTARATGLAEGWAAAQPTAAEQGRELEGFRSYSRTEQSRLGALTSPEGYTAAVAWMDLRGELERYGKAVQSRNPRTFLLTLQSSAPLVSVLASLYGAQEANRIYSDVIRLNAIANPLAVRANSELRLPARS